MWHRLGHRHLSKVQQVQIQQRKWLSNAQVATALRPFYFLVHPDLFGRWPREQAVNETSLKMLKSHLAIMMDERKRPKPLKATFYVKHRGSSKASSSLNMVQLKLNSNKVRDAISSILKTVDLPTSYVDSVPETADESNLVKSYEDIVHEFDLEQRELRKRRLDLLHHTDTRRPLKVWLTDNVETARSRMSKLEPVRLQTQRLQDELCCDLELTDILWDCGWDTSHRRGVLDAFHSLCNHHPDLKSILKGRTVVFGLDSGMSLDGQVILFTGEVRSNWLTVIRRIPDDETALKNIPLVEKALSQSLRDIRIVRRTNQPIRLADNYKEMLIKLVTNINDYLSKKSLPSSWPSSMSAFELCVDNESSPLTLTASGQFIVPASCPGFLLVPFITEHMNEALDKLAKVEDDNEREFNLVIACINELGLIQLDRDDSLNSKTMSECCSRLLKHAHELRHLTHGNHLIVSRYYSVNADGVMCIPWNWKESMD